MTAITNTASTDTATWQEIDRRHHVHPFVDPRILAEKGTRVIVGAEGRHLIDSEGRRILDRVEHIVSSQTVKTL